MGIRAKLFLIFFFFGVTPVLLLSVFNYLSAAQAVENLLRKFIEEDADRITRDVTALQRDYEAALNDLSRAPSLRSYVRSEAGRKLTLKDAGPRSRAAVASQAPASPINAIPGDTVPYDVRADVSAFFQRWQRYCLAIACLNTAGKPLFRLDQHPPGTDPAVTGSPTPQFQVEDFLLSSMLPDQRVWGVAGQAPLLLRSPVARGAFGPTVRYTIPVFTEEKGPGAPRGALLVDLKLDELFREAAEARGAPSPPTLSAPEPATTPHIIIVLDRNGQIIYHTNDALRYQPVHAAMPSTFKAVADAMIAGESGWGFYESSDGERRLAVYRPIAPLDLSLAVAGNETATARSVKRAGRAGIIISILISLVLMAVLVRAAGRTSRSIERVTEGAVAIAAGKLDQHIEVMSSDETRLLAETFNQMSDRLREQVAREAEARQFESFLRLSAMLTHDLKNAIATLSLIVGNMERQFHHEEFRADAMQSLKEATAKLHALVARLSAPVDTLSGEHRLPRPTDLIPIIKRVLASTAEPSLGFHEMEARLPAALVATVEADRIERVVENLILNALEAMGAKGGRLTVEAGPAGPGEVFFSVTDTGPGMSPEFQRTRLFRPFATTKQKGVGLGLYTCREVVKANHGHIDVESRPGVGTTFRVVLPLGRITSRDQGRAQETAAAG